MMLLLEKMVPQWSGHLGTALADFYICMGSFSMPQKPRVFTFLILSLLSKIVFKKSCFQIILILQLFTLRVLGHQKSNFNKSFAAIFFSSMHFHIFFDF